MLWYTCRILNCKVGPSTWIGTFHVVVGSNRLTFITCVVVRLGAATCQHDWRGGPGPCDVKYVEHTTFRFLDSSLFTYLPNVCLWLKNVFFFLKTLFFDNFLLEDSWNWKSLIFSLNLDEFNFELLNWLIRLPQTIVKTIIIEDITIIMISKLNWLHQMTL